jgi:2,4-dienoyl-CoA reductase-like NADH-dependent reductase (Old Yellow Enzyme family)
MLDTVISQEPLLFTPITFRGLTARNRTMVSPMCQYASINGGPTDFHMVHLGQFALGGAGIIFCEETSIEEIGRKTHNCAGLYTREHVQAYRRINAFLRQQGALTGMQLGHAGGKASSREPWDAFRPLGVEDEKNGRPRWDTVSASAVPLQPKGIPPRALSRSEIAGVVEAWRNATLMSADADYDIVEIHAAHGYLLHQFLSPMVNQRDDAYGGGIEGRMRLTLEVAEVVREAWPADKPVFVRLSAADGQDSGWEMDDTLTLAHALKQRGIDCITPSSGGIKGPTAVSVVPRVPGYHVPYARRIRHEAEIPTIAVGLITEAEHAERILQSGEADVIALARELLWDPYWPVHAAKQLGSKRFLDLLPAGYAWWLERRETIREITRHEQYSAQGIKADE